MVNITAVDAAADGWIKAWPCDEPRSNTSSLNFTPGVVAANAAIVRLASGRSAPVPVDLTQVHDGTNTIAFKSIGNSTVVANISLIIVAGAPVP